MSSNELNFDKSNQMLQAERNCINFDGSKRFNVNYKAMSHDDKCFIDIDTRQSIGPGNYAVTNLYDNCECMMPQTVKNAVDNVTVNFKNGYGTEQSCVVDDGSKLRWGLTKAWPKCVQQLYPRSYLSVPYMGRGYLKPNEESELIFSEDTRVKKSCNSEFTIPHQYTPMVDWLSYNIQRDIHLIQEVNSPSWRRGGVITRNIITDYDYSSKCGKAYMSPSTNAWFWGNNKGQLLNQ